MIIGSEFIFIGNLPSTNTYTAGLLKEKELPEGTVIQTNYQSTGRGQAGNSWESEDGKNLLISIVLYPTMINPSDQFIISMTVSLGICDFLSRYTSLCSIKWPNDIYISNDKIAGILIESSIIDSCIKSTIAGIGININQDHFLSDAPNPVSLKMLTGKSYNLKTCLTEMVNDLDRRYKQVLSENFSQIKDEYVSKLYRLNEWHTFTDTESNFSGRIITAGSDGRLKIEKRTGETVEYSFKDVNFTP